MKSHFINLRVWVLGTMLLFVAVCGSPSRGGEPGSGITASGDVSPALPWNSYTIGYVGNTANGTLTVSKGETLTSNSCTIGYNAGATGQVTVTGTNSTWNNIAQLNVGYEGIGILQILAGGKVTNGKGYVGDNSSVTVSGLNSTWTSKEYLYLGYWGDGTLNVNSGGKVVCNSWCTVGYMSDASAATVSGAGSTWTLTDGLILGDYGNGTLTVKEGGQINSGCGILGYSSGAVGTATITGPGSAWNNTYFLAIGSNAGGSMTVNNGAMVTAKDLYVVGTGTLTVSNGGTVTTNAIYASLGSLLGNGTITAQNAVLDADLVFDATHGQKQQLAFGNGGVLDLNLNNTSTVGVGYIGTGTITVAGVELVSKDAYLGYGEGSTGTGVVSGPGSKWTNTGSLGIGSAGNGTLRIEAGGQVVVGGAMLGNNDGVGNVVVSGPGSTWTNTGGMIVGYAGRGTMLIEKGGKVFCTSSGLGGSYNFGNGGRGTVTVTGAGSQWINSSGLYVGAYGLGSSTVNVRAGGQVSNTTAGLGLDWDCIGYVNVDGKYTRWDNSGNLTMGGDGSGFINISGGAAVTTTSVGIYRASVLAIDVGTGSTLNIGGGTGTINNYSKVRFLAGAGATTNETSTPILAATWSGSGAYQALGGKWDSAYHQFTVSPVQAGTSGSAVSMNLLSTQRALIGDSATGWSLGTSFLATTASSTLNFKATAISGSTLDKLQQALDAEKPTIAGGWTFTTTSGYTSGNPVYLSFDVGPGHNTDDLAVWRYNGTSWSKYNAADLTCNGNYASFTVTALDGFAVAVPEPGMLVLLAAGMGSLLACGWRFRRACRG